MRCLKMRALRKLKLMKKRKREERRKQWMMGMARHLNERRRERTLERVGRVW